MLTYLFGFTLWFELNFDLQYVMGFIFEKED